MASCAFIQVSWVDWKSRVLDLSWDGANGVVLAMVLVQQVHDTRRVGGLQGKSPRIYSHGVWSLVKRFRGDTLWGRGKAHLF